jgi:hypothetical protein
MLRSRLILRACIHLTMTLLARDSLAQADSLKERTEGAPIELLSRWREDVQWKRDSLLLGDVTLDRETDAVVLGHKGNSVFVGIVAGPFGKTSKHWILEFATSSQDGLCGLASGARLQLEKLSIPEDAPKSCDSSEVARECRRWRETAQLLYLAAARGSKGINLGAEKCDGFHIYFDPLESQPIWWRR